MCGIGPRDWTKSGVLTDTSREGNSCMCSEKRVGLKIRGNLVEGLGPAVGSWRITEEWSCPMTCGCVYVGEFGTQSRGTLSGRPLLNKG